MKCKEWVDCWIIIIDFCVNCTRDSRSHVPNFWDNYSSRVHASYSRVHTTQWYIVPQYNRKIHRVAPDGNCFFRTLSHQAFDDQMYHAQMRKTLVMLISEKYQPIYIGRNSFHDHVSSTWPKMVYGVCKWWYVKQLLIILDYMYMN